MGRELLNASEGPARSCGVLSSATHERSVESFQIEYRLAEPLTAVRIQLMGSLMLTFVFLFLRLFFCFFFGFSVSFLSYRNELVKEHPSLIWRRTELTSRFFSCVQVRLLLCFTYVFLVAYPLVAEPIGNLRQRRVPG